MLSMSLSDAAMLLGMSAAKVAALADAREIEFIDASIPGGSKKVRRFTQRAIDEFMTRRTREVERRSSNSAKRPKPKIKFV